MKVMHGLLIVMMLLSASASLDVRHTDAAPVIQDEQPIPGEMATITPMEIGTNTNLGEEIAPPDETPSPSATVTETQPVQTAVPEATQVTETSEIPLLASDIPMEVVTPEQINTPVAGDLPLQDPNIIDDIPIQSLENNENIQYFNSSSSNTIAVGAGHACVLTTNGGVSCWGRNDYGQLGDGTQINRLTPVRVYGIESGIVALAAGESSTCALTSSGGVKCWGRNDYGQLGDDTKINRLTPVNVVGLTSGVTAIASKNVHTCALKSSGGVMCWGENEFGQLGNGTYTSSSHPVNVTGLSSGVIAVSTGYFHTCVLISSHGIKCWGGNYDGQLGDGTTDIRTIPTNVIGLSSGVTMISAGVFYTCAVLSSGKAKCWGFNLGGRLGDGTEVDRRIPTDVSGLATGVVAISAGDEHTCALLSSGGVKCWGRNVHGQVGDGTLTNRLTPTNVSGLTSGVTAIVNGYYHSCILALADVVKCWGYNFDGELGDGTTIDRSTPVKVIFPLTYTISGRVIDSSQNPIANVTISVGSSHTTQSGADGYFYLTDLPNGSYTITSSKAGYTFSPPSRSVTIANADSSGQNFTGTLSGTYTIHGSVLDNAGSPITGTVTVSAGTSQTTTTDGNYTISGLSPGLTVVSASKANYIFSSRRIDIPTNVSVDLYGTQIIDCSQATAKTPIVLVTGWGGGKAAGNASSDASGFKYFPGYLKDYGYIEGCNLFFENRTDPKLDLMKNAELIWDFMCETYSNVETIYPGNWNKKFNIIAHSYGGLRSRAYLESPDYYKNGNAECQNTVNVVKVNKLITLGSPHAGEGGSDPNNMFSTLYNLLPLARALYVSGMCFLSNPSPACEGLKEIVRQDYNNLHSQPGGVAYHFIAGDAHTQANISAIYNASKPLSGSMYPDNTGDSSDMAVHTWSAHGGLAGLPYAPNCYIDTSVHGYNASFDNLALALNNKKLSDFDSYFNPRNTFDNIIAPILGLKDQLPSNKVDCETKPSSPRLSAVESLASPVTTGGDARMLVNEGTIGSSDEISGTFEVSDAGEHIVTLHWLGIADTADGTVSLTLTDPSGTAVTDGVNGVTHASLFYELGWSDSFEIPTPSSGTWQYKVKGNVLARPVNFALEVIPPLQIAVSATAPYSLSPGAVAVLTAAVTFNDTTPVSGGSVQADVYRPNNTKETITLLDDGVHGDGAAGDGIFGTTYTNTSAAGEYTIQFSAQGTYNSQAYTRTAVSKILIADATYMISGTVTYGGSGLAGVTISFGNGTTTMTNDSGYYGLSGLAPGSYTLIPSISGRTFLPTSRTVTIGSADVSGSNFAASPLGTTITYPSGTIALARPTFKWNAMTDATSYLLWIKQGTVTKLSKLYTAAQTSCGAGTGQCSLLSPLSLTAGAYTWYIRTYNTVGYGPWSSVKSFTVAVKPLAATLVLPTGTIYSTRPTFTWNAVPGTTYYTVLVKQGTRIILNKAYTKAQVKCALDTGRCTLLSPLVLTKRLNYIWQVQTRNAYGYGPWSLAKAFIIR